MHNSRKQQPCIVLKLYNYHGSYLLSTCIGKYRVYRVYEKYNTSDSHIMIVLLSSGVQCTTTSVYAGTRTEVQVFM